MAVACVECGATFRASLAETSPAALAVGVVGKHTIAHVALATHLCLSQFAGHHQLPAAYIGRVVGPKQSFLHKEVIVVAELVSLVDEFAQAVGACGVEVILYVGIVSGIVPQCVGVDVMERFGTEHVLHRLVMPTDVLCEHQTAVEP